MRAYGGHATITIASAAFWRPRPEHGGDDHREDDRREREDEVGAAHAEAVDGAAEVAGDRADESLRPIAARATTRERERQRTRGRRRCTRLSTSRPSSSVPKRCCHDGPMRRREGLRERIVPVRSAGAKHRHHDPGGHDHDADDGERLPQARAECAAAVVSERRAEDAGAHVTRIRGSMTPYRMSTMKFTVM